MEIRILTYFNNKNPDSLFEELFSLYITGELKALLKSWKLTHISIHADWNDINGVQDLISKMRSLLPTEK